MRGREFVDLAQELLPGTASRHWRGAMIHVYYGLLLESRDTMARWGLPAPGRQQVHAQVRLRMIYAAHPDLKKIGFALEELGRHRNMASYDLRSLALFASAKEAEADVQTAADALVLLDAIDADPVRRTAAISSIRP
jgi:hypothetical protein